MVPVYERLFKNLNGGKRKIVKRKTVFEPLTFEPATITLIRTSFGPGNGIGTSWIEV